MSIPESQRVKLSIKSGNPFSLTGALAPLSRDGGVIFPYTPTIQIGHSANYGSFDITHGLYPANYYINTPNPSIALTANFTAQTEEEAAYAMAAIQFFKTCTKPDFGEQRRATAGTPPPILVLSGYGKQLPRVSVILKSFNYALPEDVDYVQVGTSSIPTAFIVSLDFGVQVATSEVRKRFNIATYASGSLLGGRGFP